MIFYRIQAPLTVVLVFFFLSVLYVSGESGLYTQILRYWGVVPFTFPFVDLHNLFASWECRRLGLDVFAHNPCDVVGRMFGYSPLWLVGSIIPLGVASTGAVGWALDLLFLLSLILLPPPQRPLELALIVLASLSTMVAFAVERANLDVLVFMLAVFAGYLALRRPPTRLFAYLVVLFAGLFLKYYPLTLMILSFRDRVATFVAVNFATLCLVVVFVVAYYSDLARGIPLIASGSYYEDYFAAKNLPLGIVEALQHSADASEPSPSLLGPVGGTIYFLMVWIGAAICWWILRAGRLHSALVKVPPHEGIFLVIGSAIIVVCFFAGQNLGYRGIFLLLVIPGLLAVSRNATVRSVRALGVATNVVIVLLMWGECFRQNLVITYNSPNSPQTEILATMVGFWLVREFAWWWVVSVMTAILLDFLWWSETSRTLSSALRRRMAHFRQI